MTTTFNRAAMIEALQAQLESAPVIEGGTGTELALNLGAIVDAMLIAGNPDSLIVPPYDPLMAPDAWHRVAMPSPLSTGTELRFEVTADGVSTSVRTNGQVAYLGSAPHDSLWHGAMAMASAAIAARAQQETL